MVLCCCFFLHHHYPSLSPTVSISFTRREIHKRNTMSTAYKKHRTHLKPFNRIAPQRTIEKEMPIATIVFYTNLIHVYRYAFMLLFFSYSCLYLCALHMFHFSFFTCFILCSFSIVCPFWITTWFKIYEGNSECTGELTDMSAAIYTMAE